MSMGLHQVVFSRPRSRYLGVVLMGCMLALSMPASAIDGFKKVTLSQGITIEIPAHWNELPVEERQNLSAMGSAIAAKAGIELEGLKTNLLAVNAVPAPTQATIRVSSTTRPTFTAADLLAMTDADFLDAGRMVLEQFRQAEKSGGIHVLGMATPSVVTLSGHPTYMMTYFRSGIVDKSEKWQVTQFQSPLPDRNIQVTVSWNVANEPILKPMLVHVIDSVKF